MSKKKIVIISIITFAMAVIICILIGRSRQMSQTPHLDSDQYETAEPYRKSRADQRVLPQYIIEGTEDGPYMRYEYDDKARQNLIGKMGEIGKYPIREVYYAYDGTEQPLNVYSYTYNDDGEMTSETCYKADTKEVVYRVEMIYFSNGQLRREVTYADTGSGMSKMLDYMMYYYDENQVLCARDQYTNSELTFHEEVKCNQNGDPVLVTVYYPDGTVNGTRHYVYTETGELAEYSEYAGDQIVLNVKYIYDSKDYLRRVDYTEYSYQTENRSPDIASYYKEVKYSDEDQPKLGTLE